MINKNMGMSGNMKDVKKVIKVGPVGPIQSPSPIRCFRAPCPGGPQLPGPTRPKTPSPRINPRPKSPAPQWHVSNKTTPRNTQKLKNIFG